MPHAYLDVPPAIGIDAKKRLVKEVYAAIDEAYHIPDNRFYLREWPPENVSQDGRLNSEPSRPVLYIEAPSGIRADVKRTMFKRITTAIDEAYHLPEIMIFIREYPLDMVSLNGGLQSENPMILEAMEKALSG